jgi:branched-chain amino acid transport system ATP-binding protein
VTEAAPAAPAAANGTAEPIFSAQSVVKRFGGIKAVNGATMQVGKGSITALIGPNGAGKTTFFNVITGFYKPDAGSAMFLDNGILGRPPHTIA